MLRTASLYALSREFKRHLPSIQGRLRRVLALWVKGAVLAHNGCQDSTAVVLEMHGHYETVRRELREWTYDDADRIRSWGPGTEVDAAACFPELLRWVLDLWTPGGGDSATETSLVLALDPTHPRDAWVALVVSVVYREQAIPVAWHVVKADASESWIAHYRRLLGLLAPAVPPGMPVHVLCDRGLDSRDLWGPDCGAGLASRPALLAARHLPPDRRRPGPGAVAGRRTGHVLGGGGRGLRRGPPARHADRAARQGVRGALGPVDRHPAGAHRGLPLRLPPLD